MAVTMSQGARFTKVGLRGGDVLVGDFAVELDVVGHPVAFKAMAPGERRYDSSLASGDVPAGRAYLASDVTWVEPTAHPA